MKPRLFTRQKKLLFDELAGKGKSLNAPLGQRNLGFATAGLLLALQSVQGLMQFVYGGVDLAFGFGEFLLCVVHAVVLLNSVKEV